MLGAPDDEQLSFAENTGRILITFDTDFIEMVNEQKHHPSVLYVDQRGKRIGDVVRMVDTYLARFSEKDFKGVHYL